jgi:hypothetical protein
MNFIRVVMAPAIEDATTLIAASAVISISIQYVLTLVESALFDGSLPAPWKIDWTEGGPLPWLISGAILCLLLDVLLNVGGVGYFLANLHAVQTGPLKISVSVMGIIEVIGTIAFATLLAVGSELLDEFANHIAGAPRNRPQEHRHARKPAPEGKQPPQSHVIKEPDGRDEARALLEQLDKKGNNAMVNR